jgi:hypothetical protein
VADGKERNPESQKELDGKSAQRKKKKFEAPATPGHERCTWEAPRWDMHM